MQKVIIGGQLNIVDNVGRNRIASINAPAILNVDRQSNEKTNILVYAHNDKLIVDVKDQGKVSNVKTIFLDKPENLGFFCFPKIL